MTKQEALNLVAHVCAEYKGTLKDHQLLQEALKILKEEEKKPKTSA